MTVAQPTPAADRRASLARRFRRFLSVLGVGLVTGCLAVGSAPDASAHDVLRGTSPADHSTVASLPDEVVLTFDQPALAVGTEVVVVDAGGSSVQEGPPTLLDSTVHQRLRAGPPGDYVVRWRVTSADGHPISGTFSFTADTGRTTTASAATPSVSSPSIAGAGPVTGIPAASSATPITVVAALLVALVAVGAAVLLRRRRRKGRAGRARSGDPGPLTLP